MRKNISEESGLLIFSIGDSPAPALEPVARSQRPSSLRLREATGWRPRVRAGTEGWRLIVAEGVAA
jgi:hypothetical protein